MSQNSENDYQAKHKMGLLAVIPLAMLVTAAGFSFGAYSNRENQGLMVGFTVMAIGFGAFASFLIWWVLHPPVYITLNDIGATFKSPPLVVRWTDVFNADVSHQYLETIVELNVSDANRYVSALSEKRLGMIEFDLTSNRLRFKLPKNVDIDRLQHEFNARIMTAPKFAAAQSAALFVSEPTESFVFNVRYLAGFMKINRLYRVYFREGSFYMIRIAGPGNMDQVGLRYGVLGLVLVNFFFNRGDKSPFEIEQLDKANPETVLSEHRHNFKFWIDELIGAKIDPKSKLRSHGPSVGRLTLLFENGKKRRFQFEDVRHMRTALVNLPPVLKASLHINVRWNDAQRAYVTL